MRPASPDLDHVDPDNGLKHFEPEVAALHAVALWASHALGNRELRRAPANLQDIRDTTQHALGEMRLLLYELRPPLLEEQGLASAPRARLQSVDPARGPRGRARGVRRWRGHARAA